MGDQPSLINIVTRPDGLEKVDWPDYFPVPKKSLLPAWPPKPSELPWPPVLTPAGDANEQAARPEPRIPADVDLPAAGGQQVEPFYLSAIDDLRCEDMLGQALESSYRLAGHLAEWKHLVDVAHSMHATVLKLESEIASLNAQIEHTEVEMEATADTKKIESAVVDLAERFSDEMETFAKRQNDTADGRKAFHRVLGIASLSSLPNKGEPYDDASFRIAGNNLYEKAITAQGALASDAEEVQANQNGIGYKSQASYADDARRRLRSVEAREKALDVQRKDLDRQLERLEIDKRLAVKRREVFFGDDPKAKILRLLTLAAREASALDELCVQTCGGFLNVFGGLVGLPYLQPYLRSGWMSGISDDDDVERAAAMLRYLQMLSARIRMRSNVSEYVTAVQLKPSAARRDRSEGRFRIEMDDDMASRLAFTRIRAVALSTAEPSVVRGIRLKIGSKGERLASLTGGAATAISQDRAWPVQIATLTREDGDAPPIWHGTAALWNCSLYSEFDLRAATVGDAEDVTINVLIKYEYVL